MEKPKVSVSKRESGVIDLVVSPYESIISVRDKIDGQRSTAINFVFPTVGDISLRLGYGVELESIIGNVAEIEYCQPSAPTRHEVVTAPL